MQNTLPGFHLPAQCWASGSLPVAGAPRAAGVFPADSRCLSVVDSVHLPPAPSTSPAPPAREQTTQITLSLSHRVSV